MEEYREVRNRTMQAVAETVEGPKGTVEKMAEKIADAVMDAIAENYRSITEVHSIVEAVRAAEFFHVAGPLTLYPVTKSAAAEELEKRISSVVTKSLTLLDARCFLRSVAAPLLRDFSDVFSLRTAPANSTNPSVVTIPLPDALPRFKKRDHSICH